MKQIPKTTSALVVALAAVSLHLTCAYAADNTPAVIPADDAAWEKFMATHDLLYPQAVTDGTDCPPLGNGVLAARVHTDSYGQRFFVRVERGDCMAEVTRFENSTARYSFGAVELQRRERF